MEFQKGVLMQEEIFQQHFTQAHSTKASHHPSRTLCKIVPQEQISESAVRRDLRFFVLIRED